MYTLVLTIIFDACIYYVYVHYSNNFNNKNLVISSTYSSTYSCNYYYGNNFKVKNLYFYLIYM